MGDNRIGLYIGLIAVSTQIAAGYLGMPDAQLNALHVWIIWFVAIVMTLPNVAMIALFRYRLRHPVAPDRGTALIALGCLAWHGYALFLLSAEGGQRELEFFVHVLMDRTVSTGYQAAQVGAFTFVLVTALLPRRAGVPQPR